MHRLGLALVALLALAPCTAEAQEHDPAVYGASGTLTAFAAALTVGGLYEGEGEVDSRTALGFAAIFYGLSEVILVASALGGVLGEADSDLFVLIGTTVNFAGLAAVLAGVAILPLLRADPQRVDVRAGPGGLAVAGVF